MRPSPELTLRRGDLLVAAVVAVLAVACGVLVWGRGAAAEELAVVVSVDGEEVERQALAAFSGAEYTHGGYTLVLSAEGGGVRVSESDCPTQDCVHTGTVTRPGQSIVCLPARIVVRLEGGEALVDAVVG